MIHTRTKELWWLVNESFQAIKPDKNPEITDFYKVVNACQDLLTREDVTQDYAEVAGKYLLTAQFEIMNRTHIDEQVHTEFEKFQDNVVDHLETPFAAFGNAILGRMLCKYFPEATTLKTDALLYLHESVRLNKTFQYEKLNHYNTKLLTSIQQSNHN